MEQTIKISDQFNKYLKETVPYRFQENITKVYSLLKNEGCNKVYLFGSLVNGNVNEKSDIDIGIKGLPDEKFFRVYSAVNHISDITIDLVDFDDSNDFFSLLNEIGKIKEIE